MYDQNDNVDREGCRGFFILDWLGFWDELQIVIQHVSLPLCVGGDFNADHFPCEKR